MAEIAATVFQRSPDVWASPTARLPASAFRILVIQHFAIIARLQVTAISGVVAMKIVKLGRRQCDRVRQHMPLDILTQRRRQRTEIVEVTQVCRQQLADIKFTHRFRLPRTYDTSHDGVERRIGGAFVKQNTDHRQTTIFGLVHEVQFERISLAVEYMFAGRMKVKLLQLKTASTDGRKISRRYVDLYRVGVVRYDGLSGLARDPDAVVSIVVKIGSRLIQVECNR